MHDKAYISWSMQQQENIMILHMHSEGVTGKLNSPEHLVNELSLKKSLANGDEPLQKPAPARDLRHNCKQKPGIANENAGSVTAKPASENKSLISEKETKRIVNKKHNLFASYTNLMTSRVFI